MMKIYLLIINIIGFIICYIDKYKAKRKLYRIPENTLLLICLVGGCLGFYLGMIIFHHKTKKSKFYIFVPIIILLWICLILHI